MVFTRRAMLMGALAAGTAAGLPLPAHAGDPLAAAIAAVEQRLRARVGLAALDTGSGRRWAHRADERFPLNSTFKAFACAALLMRVDAGKEDLARRLRFGAEDLVSHSPVTEKRAGGGGMTLGELCEATMTLSDNTAANLVLDAIGGPDGFTAFMRGIGDGETRLDRREPELNDAKQGDPRDTTTPAAAAKSLHDLVLGDLLSEASRGRLWEWLAGNKVADGLLRAALPEGWEIGDRSGAGRRATRSVIAVIRPPGRQPVVAAVYLDRMPAAMDERNAAIAEIGRALVKALEE